MSKTIRFIIATSLWALTGVAIAQSTLKEVTVAYFLEWPTPNQVAQLEKTFDNEMGVKVSWRAFGNGNEMTAAMISGDVHIAYSQGHVPFILAANKGVPIKLVGVAVAYAENDNCIIRTDAGITKDNPKALEGKRVATLIGNVTHYKFLRSLDHLGIDVSKVDVLAMDDGAAAAAALIRGDVVMACAFGGPLARMKTVGFPLLTGAEQEAYGIRVFDVISTTNDFAQNHRDLLVKFLQVTEDANNRYHANPKAKIPTIAKAAGMSKKDTRDTIGKFIFPSATEQISDAWMGGTVEAYTTEIVDFMVGAGEMEQALNDYSGFVDTTFLQQVR